jgi:hypothetical protein
MQSQGISRVDGGGSCGTLTTRLDHLPLLLSAQTKKNQDRLIDAFHVFGVEMPDAVSPSVYFSALS